MADPATTLGHSPPDLKRRRLSITPTVPGTNIHFGGGGFKTDDSPPRSVERRNAPRNNILGRLSYAPATQTTVVTTTTTTTTKFPPFVMKAPRHLDQRDPKLYPLADSPTPSSIRQFQFDLNGQPTCFREAGNVEKELIECGRHYASLEKHEGYLQTTTTTGTGSFTPSQVVPLEPQPASGNKQDSLESSKSQKLSATPVSLSDAAELASLRRRSTISRLGPPHLSLPRPHPLCQGQTYGPLSDNEEQINISISTNSNDYKSHGQDLSVENLEHFERIGSRENGTGLGLSVEDTAMANTTTAQTATAATPPIADSDRDPVQRLPSADDQIRPGLHRLLSHTPLQEASLPSPSLSPITGAARLNFDSESTEYFDDASSSERPYSSHNAATRITNRQTLSPPPAEGDKSPTEADGSKVQLPLPSYMEIPTLLDSFDSMPEKMQTYVMYQLLRRCAKPTLHFVADVVNPALKCDFLNLLPLELSLNVLQYLDAKSMCQAAQVSRKWRHIVNSDERAWKDLLVADGFSVEQEEIERAVREGWGWQNSFGMNESERDLGSSSSSLSDMVEDLASFNAAAEMTSFHGQAQPCRRKRKASARHAGSKRQKRSASSISRPQLSTSIQPLALDQGPNRLAYAAAAAVPHANVGLPSLNNLHFFKSIYRRHHLIRQSWMQMESKPQHLAFRAHQRHVVTCLQFDDDRIITGSDDTNINVFDTKTGALLKTLIGHEGGVWALEYQGNVLVSGSTDRSVRIWNIDEGKCVQVFQGHTSTVRCLQILQPSKIGESADGSPIMMPLKPIIITGSRDSNLRVWKLPSPTDRSIFHTGPPQAESDNPYFIRALTGHLHSVRAIAARADTLVSGSYDSTVRVWKISTGELVHRLAGHTTKVYSVVLDYERNRCISGSMDNLVKVWSLESGACLFNLEGHTSLVGLLDLSHGCLVSAAADSTLRIWDPENGRCRNILKAHTGAITCFQHDGQKVISGSDRTLKMWNVKTGECLKDLLTDLSGVWQVKFNERRCVAAVQRDGVTYIEVLDFGAFRDGIPDDQRGKRIVVDTSGNRIQAETSIEPETMFEPGN